MQNSVRGSCSRISLSTITVRNTNCTGDLYFALAVVRAGKESVRMNVTSSLLLGFIVTVLLFLLLKLSSIVRTVESWIEWFRHVRQACALPSPPGRWFWGHALDVSQLTHSWMHVLVYQPITIAKCILGMHSLYIDSG